MRINHNIAALNTHRQLNTASTNQSKSMEKLASGLRINKAGDDAAGLAISEKMRGQIRGLDQASKNSQDAISMISTAEGALNETHDILQRMRELAVQSGNDTNTNDDRKQIQGEVDQLAKEITRISNTTEFNTQNLMAGGLNNTYQIGANKGQNINLTVNAMDAKSLGVAGDLVAYGLGGANTGVTSANNLSQDLSGYKIATLATQAATASPVTASDGAMGTLTIASGATFNGSSDQNFTIRIDAADAGGKVTSASISRDGGTNWTSLTVDASGTDTTAVLDGLALTLTTDTDNAQDKTWTFNATAEYKQVQLQTSGNTPVGAATKVYNNQTSAKIGLGDKTLEVGFTYSGLTASQSDSITKTATSSKAAVIAPDGTVANEAVTYKGIDVSSQKSADAAINTINDAILKVSGERSKLGAYQNRLEHTINNLNTSSENLTSAESRIRDVDMAKEMMTQTKNSILSQAAQAMLAQANQQPQGVLQLLR